MDNDTNAVDSALNSKGLESKRNLKRYSFQVLVIVLVSIVVVVNFNYFAVNTSDKVKDEQPAITSINPVDVAKIREKFKTTLSEFNNTEQVLLDNNELISWSNNTVETIDKIKENAIASFAKASYSEALSKIKNASDETEKLSNQWGNAFKEKYQLALQYFNQGNMNMAGLELNLALKIKPSDQQGFKLKNKIEAYPIIADLFDQLDVAYTENNLGKEIVILEQILKLSPERVDVKDALEQAVYNKKDSQFQEYITNGLERIAANDLTTADRYYNKAQSIFPNRTESLVLAKKLDKVDAQVTLTSIHQRLHKVEQTDDWQLIKQMTIDAQAYYPADPLLTEFQQKSDEIIYLKAQAFNFNNYPERLSDITVQDNAKKYIKSAINYLADSKELSDAILNLSKNIKKFASKHPLEIISDNKTHIIALRQGVVGKVHNKIIELPIGDYVFEGSREGYRSKQLTITIDGKTTNKLILKCDERIR